MNKPCCPHCNAGFHNLALIKDYTHGNGYTKVIRCRQCGHRIYREFASAMTREVDYSRQTAHAEGRQFPTYPKATCTLEGCNQQFPDTHLATSRLCTEHSRMLTGWKIRQHLPCPFIKTETGYIWNPEHLERKAS